MSIDYKIISCEKFNASDIDSDFKDVSRLGGCSDYGNSWGLGFYEIDFVILVECNNKKRKFTVIFQTAPRNEKLRNYAGFEMCEGRHVGCDNDDSRELLEFCNDDDSIIAELQEIAENIARHNLYLLLELRKEEEE